MSCLATVKHGECDEEIEPLRHVLDLILREARRHAGLLAAGLAPVAAAAPGSGGSRWWRRRLALRHQAAEALEALAAEVADQAAVGDLDVQGTCGTQARVSLTVGLYRFGRFAVVTEQRCC